MRTNHLHPIIQRQAQSIDCYSDDSPGEPHVYILTLIPTKEVLTEKPLELVEISQIDLPRIARDASEAFVSSLSSSMHRMGQIEPVVLRPRKIGRYELVCGRRRFQAARSLGWQKIQARILDLDDKSAASMMLAENLERKDFTDYELAKFFEYLSNELKMSYGDIAEASGRSKAYISQHISMVNLFRKELMNDPSVQHLMQSITERESRILSRVSDEKTRLSLAKIAVQEHMCVRELDKLAGRAFNSLSTEDINFRSTSRTGKPTDKEQIKDKITSLFECVNNKNLQPLIEFRDENGFTLFDDFPPLSLHKGRAAIDHCFDVIESTRGRLHFRSSNIRIRCFKSFAIATLYLNYENIDKPHVNASKRLWRSRVSVVLTKKKGKWIIIHEHWSPLESRLKDASIIDPAPQIRLS